MSELDERFIRFWSEKRKRGKWNYAFRHGVLFFAWPVFVLSEAFKYFFNSDYMLTPSRIIGGLIIWTVLGFLAFGLLQWRSMEKRFDKLTRATDQADGTGKNS